VTGFSANPAHVRLDVHTAGGAWLETAVLDMTGFYDRGPGVREAVADAIAATPCRPGDQLLVVNDPWHRDPRPVVLTPEPGPASDQAAAAERRIEALQDLVANLNLYASRHTWSQLTTEQKELFADAVDADRARSGDDDGYRVERWWRD
jgi:hypothetical protein